METEALLNKLAAERQDRVDPDGPCLTEAQLRHFKAGTLAPGDRDAMEAHLSSCDLCLDRAQLGEETPRLSERSMARILDETQPRRQPLWPRAWLGGLVAAAAAVALVILLPGKPTAQPPPYSLALSGAVATSRGSEPAPQAIWGQDSTFVMRLAPQSPVTGGQVAEGDAVQAMTYVGRSGGALHQTDAQAEREIDPLTGLIELRYAASNLFAEGPGSYRVGVLVAPVELDLPAVIAGASPTVPDGARLLTAEATYHPE